jgi:sarcosine oxidase
MCAAMTPDYDVAVIGLGAMGSAAAYHLARGGARVLGIDRFAPPHTLGSSHGETRIIREAYFEDPCYVPLVQRAAALWRELEAESGRSLMVRTGGLMIGRPDGTLVRGAIASAETHRLAWQQLDAATVRARFPVLQPPDDLVAVWEPDAGVLFPESCVAAHLELAGRHGATFALDEPVESWRADGDGFEITTARGRHRAAHLVLAANAWLDRLLPGVRLPLSVARQPLFWFEPADQADAFAPDRMPIYLWEPEPDRFFYGFPSFGGLVKVAVHGRGRVSDPDGLDRMVSDAEVEAMREPLARYMPSANGRFARAAVCMYANTPDDHFLIDRHPEHPRVLVISACSGHGFKFSSAIGELVPGMLLQGGNPTALIRFRWRW